MLLGAVGALAFATALKPHGYQRASGFIFVFILGLAIFLVLAFILGSLLHRVLPRHRSRVRYLALGAALALLIAGAATRALTIATPGENRHARLTRERDDFQRWTQAAIPLIVRYGDALRVDAALVRGAEGSRAEAGLRAGVLRAERVVLHLRHESGRLLGSSPPALRSFVRLLPRALALAAAAQRAYAAGLVPRTAGGQPRRCSCGAVGAGSDSPKRRWPPSPSRSTRSGRNFPWVDCRPDRAESAIPGSYRCRSPRDSQR